MNGTTQSPLQPHTSKRLIPDRPLVSYGTFRPPLGRHSNREGERSWSRDEVRLKAQRAAAVKGNSKRATPHFGPTRDFRGYGAEPPVARWPGGARIAVNVNLNVEAGGEHSILEGDAHSEDMLTDIGFPAYKGKRSPMVESVFEYGARVGCWRLLRIFKRFDVKISVMGVVRGLQMYPELTRAFVEDGHEIVSHGWRWLDYCEMKEKEERRTHQARDRGHKEADRGAAGWLVQRPIKHQHAPTSRGGGRLPIRP